MNTSLTINAHNIVIDSTEFGTNFGRKWICPYIEVSHSTSFTFSNNNFSNCKFPNFMAIVSFDITKNSNLAIINCTFMKVVAYPSMQVTNTNEINNNQDTRIISVNTQEDQDSVLTINESRFIANSIVKVLTVQALPKVNTYHVIVILHGLILINNTATSELVEMNCYTTSNEYLGVTLSNVLVNGNNVGSTTDWSQAVGGLYDMVSIYFW